MTKTIYWSSGAGIVSLFFMLAATTGAVFQFIFLYLPVFKLLPGDSLALVMFIISIATMAFGGSALIFSIFGAPKWLWIVFASLLLAGALVIPIIGAIRGAPFYYFNGVYSKVPFGLIIPTNALLDFLGFWMAAAGALVAMIGGFFVPKD